MFVIGRLYRHKHNRDVAFEVIRTYFVRPKDAFKLKVCWWNIGTCHLPEPMNISQRLTIPCNLAGDWTSIRFDERMPAIEHVEFRISS